MKSFFGILFLVVLLAPGCTRKYMLRAVPDGKEIYREHMIEITPLSVHKNRELEGVYLDQKRHFAEIIKGIDAHLKKGNKKILVFIHGGLNSPTSSFKRGLTNTRQIMADGVYPVFVNWHSGPLSSYGQQMFGISAGLNFRLMKKIIFPLFIAKDLMVGAAKLPQSWFNNASSYLINVGQYDSAGGKWTRTRKNIIPIYDSLYNRMKQDPASSIRVHMGKDERACGSSWRGAYSVLTGPTRMAGTFLWDGLGTPAWINMKRRAHALFHAPNEFDIRKGCGEARPVDEALDTEYLGVFALFLDTLQKYLKTCGHNYEITLMGHSMGAIVANDVLTNFPDLPIENIVHMAGASSLGDMAAAVYPFLLKHPTAKFYNLMLHPASDNREQMFFGTELLLPRGSLLVHIDNMFEESTSFLGRASGKWENIIQATHMIPVELRPRITLKCFDIKNNKKPFEMGMEEAPSNVKVKYFRPQEHGQFDDGPYWLEEFWQVK